MLPRVTEWCKHYRKVPEIGGDETPDFRAFMDTLKLHRTMLQFHLVSRSLVRTQQGSPYLPDGLSRHARGLSVIDPDNRAGHRLGCRADQIEQR